MKDDATHCGDIDAILAFSMSYNHSKAHNMLMIMFDP
jgi:hypothetical protein